MSTFVSKDDMDNYKKIPSYKVFFKLSLAVADEVTVADLTGKEMILIILLKQSKKLQTFLLHTGICK
jgi:hypothetical protein